MAAQVKPTIITNLMEIKLLEIDTNSGKQNLEMIVEAIMREAKRGDIKMIQLLFDRIEGPVQQDIGINSSQPLGVVILPEKE